MDYNPSPQEQKKQKQKQRELEIMGMNGQLILHKGLLRDDDSSQVPILVSF